jgi:hypothetical protein
VCKRRENQPGYVPVEIRPQKQRKEKPPVSDVDEDEETPSTFQPLFEPDEPEGEPKFL